MAHLIEAIRESSVRNAIDHLERVHALIVQRAMESQREVGSASSAWGSDFKRLEVQLPKVDVLIGKTSEKFIEIVNILATAERTISALRWLERAFPNSFVRECHASTSDESDGNDIVLTDLSTGVVTVRCEVTDVASRNAAQNGKEKKDLHNLGCMSDVPDDYIKRYIATSLEFAQALCSPKRKWGRMHYRYLAHETSDGSRTVMLEIARSNVRTA